MSIGEMNIDNSGVQWLGLMVDVAVNINPMWSANIGVGTDLDFVGLNLPFGMPLLGKNIPNVISRRHSRPIGE